MTTPMKEINTSLEAFRDNLINNIERFNSSTGCYIKEIKLEHHFHLEEYESTEILDIEIGLIPPPFFTKE